MFQNFDPVSDVSFGSKHLPLVRAEMKKMEVDAFIIPHSDEYQNEYIPAYAERLMWVTGFSGSAGMAIVHHDRAVIFTDGRYTIQVRDQCDASLFEFQDYTAVEIRNWLKAHGKPGMRLGYDPALHTINDIKIYQNLAKEYEFSLVSLKANPIDCAWKDQPPKPRTPAVHHPENFTGQSSDEKRKLIAAAIEEARADMALITAPTSVAWLFNIRGGDVARTPLPLARAIIHKNGEATLFIDREKVDNALPATLGDGVDIREEAALEALLADYGKARKTVATDPALTPIHFKNVLVENGATTIDMTDPCALPRACKNAVEIEGARSAHIRDGAAVVKFLHWLDTAAQTGEVTEIDAATKLESYRAEYHDLRDLSFDTISGAGSNGAICHYRVSTLTNAKLARGTLYLVDSGAQYPDGTTDITRTVPIGEPSDEMRDRFTRVLKGHIALATLTFPEGTAGHHMDAFARRPLWEAGLDFDHGTGHGVGSFLGVHEGPQRIAKAFSDQQLKPGMICSNEPGFYKTDEFGIRIENLIVTKKAEQIAGGDREMLCFETITLAPIAISLIKESLLSSDEKAWLNAYHTRVRETLTPLLDENDRAWLAQATHAI